MTAVAAVSSVTQSDWASLSPLSLDIALAVGVLILIFVDLFQPPESDSIAGPLAAGIFAFVFAASFFVDTSGTAFGGSYVGGPWALFLKRIFLASGFLAALGSFEHVRAHQPRREGEYYILLLFSVLGMSLLPGTRDLILLIVCFELMGMPLYVLASYGKTDKPPFARPTGVPGVGLTDAGAVHFTTAPEAGMKLYVVGAASTSITLFGLSLVFGAAGTTDILQLMQATPTSLLAVGVAFVFAGLGYKIGIVPFHMWIPDTYQGADTPFVAFLSVASKTGALAALVVLFVLGFAGESTNWVPYAVGLCVATMVVGNVFALAQTNVKRLFGYSGIAHAGYMLMALVAWKTSGIAMLLFYLAAYVVMNTGTFLVVEAVSRDGAEDRVANFDGLARRSPWLGLAMLLFLLSLAGIPFVVGFWAKLYLFVAVWQAGYPWLVLVGAALALVGLFYYLQVARAIYMKPPAEDHSEPIKVGFGLSFAILTCLIGVVAFGVWPGVLLEGAEAAAAALVK